MPIYEYECRGCGWEGERRADLDNRDQQVCGPHCGAVLRRVEISLTARHNVSEEYGALLGSRSTPTDRLQPVSGKWGEEAPKKGPRRRIL